MLRNSRWSRSAVDTMEYARATSLPSRLSPRVTKLAVGKIKILRPGQREAESFIRPWTDGLHGLFTVGHEASLNRSFPGFDCRCARAEHRFAHLVGRGHLRHRTGINRTRNGKRLHQ